MSGPSAGSVLVALVVLLRGVNVGGHKTFRPTTLTKQLKHLDAVNIGAAGTFVIRQRVTRMQLRAMREEKENKWRLKATFWSVAVIAGLCILAPICMGLIVRVLVARVPASVELQMGATAMAEIKQEMTFLNDSNLSAKLDAAVAPLVAALPPGPGK